MAEIPGSDKQSSAQETLPGLPEDLSVILDHIDLGVTVQDATGRLIHANPAAAKLVGYESVDQFIAASPGAVINRWEILDEDDRHLPTSAFPSRRVINGEPEAEATLCFRSRDSSYEFWAELRARGVFHADGSLRFIVTHWSDVTERRRIEEGDRRMAAIFNTSDDAIVSKRLDGTIMSWNPSAERLFGWTAEEMVGASITRIVPLDKREELAGILARLGRGERIDHHETERVTKDGRRLDISVSITPIRDRSGRVIGGAKIARDITARRSAERFADAFLADLAHDLNNPLAAARVQCQMLMRRVRRGQIDPRQIDDGLRAIESSLGRIDRRIGELADIARLRLGQALDLRPEAIDLVSLAEGRSAFHQRSTTRHALSVVAAEPSIVGQWDRDRIERVLDNLLLNAIKYAPEGGTVTVRVSQEEAPDGTACAVLSVSDQGVGIPMSDLPVIFNRFQRGGNVVGRFAGAGIGLAGAKQIIERHHGTITVESREGTGTTVTLRLPLQPPG